MTDRIVGSNETEKSSSGAFAGMFVAVLLLAAIVTLFLYYRKRVATLKTVIAHVQYGADPLSNPGTPLVGHYFYHDTTATFTSNTRRGEVRFDLGEYK